MFNLPKDSRLQRRTADLERTVQLLQEREAALSDEVSWRRLLLDQSRDAIVIVDEGAKVYESNQRFADMLGYTLAEMKDLHVWDWDAILTREQILDLAQCVDAEGHCFETQMCRKDGSIIDVEMSNNGALAGNRKLILCVCRDTSERNRTQREKELLIARLQEALAEIKTLKGVLPICSFCNKIRDDEGQWQEVDAYLAKYSGADVSHGLCPDCFEKHYPDEFETVKGE